MKKTVVIILLLFCSFHFYGQDRLTKAHQETIAEFIGFFKTNDREKIADNVSYPLKREYPLPEIKNKAEFLKRFEEVFDARFVDMITKSDPLKEDDWIAMGYRGIMMGTGSIWLDYDGTLLAVNYQSGYETKKMADLIVLEKKTLHPSISKFFKPVVILKTAKYRIRIDDMGQGQYRYASWKVNSAMNEKPDLVIENGEFFPDGSGGNHHFTFKNGKYIYECGITPLGEDGSPPAYITIYKGGKEILNEPATILQS